MRLIFLIYLTVIFIGCDRRLNSNKNCNSIPETICSIINTIHEKHPFPIDSIKNEYGLNEQISIIFYRSKPIEHVYMKILAKELDCGKISFTLLKDKDDFRANHFLYYTFIGIELLNDDCSKIRFKRFTDEFFQRPGSGVGLDYSTSENYYMNKVDGKWIIDSLVHDMSL